MSSNLPTFESLYTFSSANADPLLLLYTQYELYTKVFDITAYFNTITDVDVSAQSSAQVLQNNIAQNLATNKVLNIDPLVFTSNMVAQSTDVSLSLSYSSLTEDAEIQGVTQVMTSALLNDFSAHVDNTVKGVVLSGSISNNITYDHSLMKQYTDDINKSIAYKYFNKVQNILASKFSPLQGGSSHESIYPENFITACVTFGKMWDTQSRVVFDVMVDSASKYFDDFFASNTVQVNELQGCLTSLGYNNIYNTAFYYDLRQHLIQGIQKNAGSCASALTNVTNLQDVSLFTYKVIADTFIKCSYPLLQYLFISRLIHMYMKKGDFVNTRLGLLANLFFTGYVVSVLSLALQNISSIPLVTLTPIQIQLNDIMTKINAYIQNMNNIYMDVNSTLSTQDQINEMQKYLMKLSQTNQVESSNNQVLQQDVKYLRLLIRNMAYNTDIMIQKNRTVKVELWVLVIITLLIVMTCVIIILLHKTLSLGDKYIKYVYYIAGGTFIIVILFKFIMYMVMLMNKN